jgi:hypothetical protein
LQGLFFSTSMALLTKALMSTRERFSSSDHGETPRG